MTDRVRVLYVDDEPDLLEIAKLFLEESGEFTVETSASAREVLDSPSILSYDIIISDYLMPEMDGITFLKRVRERFEDLPFILFTGRGREEVIIEAINNRVDFYLQKGGDPEAQFAELKHKIQQAVGRRRAERLRKESESFLTSVIEQSPYPVWISDNTGTLIRLNQALRDILRITDEEVVGKYNVFHDNIVEEQGFMPLVRTVFDAGETVHFPLVWDSSKLEGLSFAHTTKRTLAVTIFPIKDVTGRVTNAVIQHNDITEWKSTELALQALVRSMVGKTGINSLKAITENISSWLGADCVMIGEIQPDGQTVKVLSMVLDGKEVDGFSYTLNGTPCENAAEKGFCIYPDDAMRLFPESRDLVELNIRGYVGTPLRDSGGHVSGILCALSRCPLVPSPTIRGIMDIIAAKAAAEVERIRTEQALRESELLFREVFDNANDGMFLVERARDGPGKYRLVNDTAARILGYSKEEILEMSPRDIVPENIAKKIMPVVLKKLAREGHATFESENRRKDGGILPIEVSICAFRYNGKDVDLSIIRDITERKRDVEALRQANRKLNLLSGITRHDIRNQLMILDGFVALLHKQIPDNSHEQYFSRIASASSQIANMIQFTKEYEKIGVHAPVWQDLQALVDDVGKSVAPGHITFENDLPASTEVFADPLIVKVFFNLVDNAVRHGGTLTTIRFLCEKRDGDRIIICEDDGDGVREDEKERIFDLGFGKNTGFGLAISREILDITGISIKETGKAGSGARFEILVPAGRYRSASH